MSNIAMIYADGRVGILQTVADDSDEAIVKAIGKMVDRPAEWQRITPEEADAIRAARPRPEPELQPSVTRVPDHSAPVSADDLARMLAELDAHKAEVRQMIDGLLSNIESEVVRSTQAGES